MKPNIINCYVIIVSMRMNLKYEHILLVLDIFLRKLLVLDFDDESKLYLQVHPTFFLKKLCHISKTSYVTLHNLFSFT